MKLQTSLGLRKNFYSSSERSRIVIFLPVLHYFWGQKYSPIHLTQYYTFTYAYSYLIQKTKSIRDFQQENHAEKIFKVVSSVLYLLVHCNLLFMEACSHLVQPRNASYRCSHKSEHGLSGQAKPGTKKWLKARVRIHSREARIIWYHQNSPLLLQQALPILTHINSKTNIKSNLMMMTQAYKHQINKPHKDVQEHKTGEGNA